MAVQEVDGKSNDLTQWVQREKIKILFVNHKHSWLLSIVASAVVASFSLESNNSNIGAAWWLFFITITLIRTNFTKQFFKYPIPIEDYPKWRKKFFWATLMAGFAWGVGGLAIGSTLDAVSQVIILLVLIGISAVAVPLLGIDRNIMIAFQLPAVIPYLLLLVITLEGKGLILILVFSIYMAGVIVAMSRVEESIEANLESQYEMRIMAKLLQESNQELLDENEKLEHLTLVDSLTQIYNRRFFERQLEKEWKRTIRNNGSLTLLVIDIDYFKRYNDTYGHAQGDICLQTIARVLKASLQRSSDVIARIGGEEFVALLPEIDKDGALKLATIMQDKIREEAILHESSKISDYLTVSIGIASTTPVYETTALGLFKAADKALYKAKEAGRNKIVIGQIDVFDN